jgi:hypothetical protein
MSIKMLSYWSAPPVDLDDMNYCQIATKKGVESGWYVRDLVKGKRKGWKQVYVVALGTTDEGMEIWRWRKRICNPKSFRYQPRFPLPTTVEMTRARMANTDKRRERLMSVVRDEQGLYWCNKFNTWKRVDGDDGTK